MKKYSRRRFFVKSLCLLPLPAVMSFSKEPIAGERAAFSAYAGGNDKELIAKYLKEKDPLIWVFTGDSITQGAKHTQGYRSYPEIFSERIRWELGRGRDIIINTGISGNTTQTILDDFD